MKRNSIIISKALVLISTVFLSLLSCNKEVSKTLDYNDTDGSALTIKDKSYKVAYIVIEGAVGSVVGTEATDFGAMPFLASMTSNSLFSWNSISGEEQSDIANWADIFTGVMLAKHKVNSTDLSVSNLENYPLVFDRIKNTLGVRTALITNNSLVGELAKNSDMDNKQVLNESTEVVTEAIKEFKNENAAFVAVTLNDVRKAGEEFGYGPDVSEYVSALNKVDGYIKNIVESIRQRTDYKSEKWLIVITSEKGGKYELPDYLDDKSLYSDTERNNFVLFHNNQFNYKIVQKIDVTTPAYTGSAVRFTGSANTASIPAAKASIYNFGNNVNAGEYTIQMKFKLHQLGTLNPAIVSKMAHTGNSDDGWSFIYNGASGWRFKGKSVHAVDNTPFDTEKWYTLTAKIYNSEGTRKVAVYTNGVKKAETNLNNLQLSSSAPLNLGYSTAYAGGSASHSIADFRIYNVALSDTYIANRFCTTAVYEDDIYWDNLIGYWPGVEGQGIIMKDQSKSKNDFTISGTPSWNSFSDVSAVLCPEPANLIKSTIRSLDIPLLTYNWIGVLGTNQFNLDSQSWSPSYSAN